VKIKLTNHAREQMSEQEDNVTKKQIKTALKYFHDDFPGNTPNTIRYIGYIGVARELNVVAERQGVAMEPVKIITVYWE
jgi:hypothetical protein